jgi:hypothetical protein
MVMMIIRANVLSNVISRNQNNAPQRQLKVHSCFRVSVIFIHFVKENSCNSFSWLFCIFNMVFMDIRVSHQKHQVRFSWGLSAIRQLQTLTKFYKKESARLDKISDLQEVLKDFTVISALYMKIWIFGLSWLWFFSVEKLCTNMKSH